MRLAVQPVAGTDLAQELPDQPRAIALDHAAAELRVSSGTGGAVAIPNVVLELGLLYLGATVSGTTGPMPDEYDQLRAERGVPLAEDDCRAQIEEMVATMTRAVHWAYDQR